MKFIFLLCLLHIPASSQIPGEKDLLDSALKAMTSKNYAAASQIFSDLLTKFPASHQRTYVSILLAESVLESGRPKYALALADQFIQTYPKSRYAKNAKSLKARALYQDAQYREAIQYLNEIGDDTNALATAKTHLSAGEMWNMIQSTPALAKKSSWIRESSQKWLAIKRSQKARESLKLLPQKKDHKTADPEGPVQIGLITSLTGANAETGLAIKRGAEMAVTEYNSSHTPKVEIAVYDDRSDMVQAILATRSACASERTAALIGPIESSSMAAVATIANDKQIPIFSATANTLRLSPLGPYVYQASVDIETRAEILAQFTVVKMKCKSLAIIAPLDAYGETVANAFARKAEQLGGHVVALEKFYDNATDFKEQLKSIRMNGFLQRADRAWTYTRLAKLTTIQKDSLFTLYYASDSLLLADEQERPTQSMPYIDALFLPVDLEDIGYIAPQIAFYNIKTQIIGGEDWNDLKTLRAQQNYLTDAVFCAEFFPTAKRAKDFESLFLRKFGQKASPEVYYTYDVLQSLFAAIQNKNFTAEDIQIALQKGVEYSGINKKFSWNKNAQTNTSLHFLRFQNGIVQSLEP